LWIVFQITTVLAMTNKVNLTALVTLPLDEVIAAARDLSRGGRWDRALNLLDATAVGPPRPALLALAAAEIALERAWFCEPSEAAARVSAAEESFAGIGHDPGSRWDLGFLLLRRDYFDQILGSGTFRPGPDCKDPDALADIGRRADELIAQAPDEERRGWAEFYRGVIADNLCGERDVAPGHYLAALRVGEAGDDLLAREALRHLGDHDHDNADHELALERWQRAAALGARAGAVAGTLSQQMLLAVCARDTGDEAGARALAGEIVRWASAIGASRLEAQASAFLAGSDPTAPADDRS
jgi:tetratricopeptide (TPR) repeat protein